MIRIRRFLNKMMGDYRPATLKNLRDIVTNKYTVPSNHFDEVYPGIFLGDAAGAKDLIALEKTGITHVMNAAYGSTSLFSVDTDEKFYAERNYSCTFKGVPAIDLSTFKLSAFFEESADFIESALSSGGKVYVHCFQGVSRSATLIIAYLMLKKNMSAVQAVKCVRNKRTIFPNDGFLEQICELDARLAPKEEVEST